MAGNSRAGRGRSGQETKLKAGCRANTPPPLPDPAEPRRGPRPRPEHCPSRYRGEESPSLPRPPPSPALSPVTHRARVARAGGARRVHGAPRPAGNTKLRIGSSARGGGCTCAAGGWRRPERLQPARTSALLAARGSASARPARRGRGGAPRRERPGAGRAGKPKYTAPRRGRVLRCQPIGAGSARRGPMGPAGGRVIGAWLRRDPEGREAARVLVGARGGA